jgi:hypothetical protein
MRKVWSLDGRAVLGHYSVVVDLVKSGFGGEHSESNQRLMYT